MSTSYVSQWHTPQHSQIHHVNSYADQDPMPQWSHMGTMAPSYPQVQHTALPGMYQQMPPMQQPSLRPQSVSQNSSAQQSPIAVSHPMSYHQHLPSALPLQPGNGMALSLGHPSPQQQSQRYSQPVPHQVVGQQGIRGVLPKSTGDRSSPDEACEPEQEQDGSWPCKFCGKKYRHAKHLRRHHARHTGETPYECQLCQRRFGRSDVLKRHYHKCATRRGQPVGDHLQGQRGHPRRRGRGPGGESGQDLGQDLGSPISNGPPEVKPVVTPGGPLPMDSLNGTWNT